jgi:hypothetical protein
LARTIRDDDNACGLRRSPERVHPPCPRLGL